MIDGAVLWKLKATYGLPLDIAFVVLARKGIAVDVEGILAAARKDGANIDRLRRDVEFYIKEAGANVV